MVIQESTEYTLRNSAFDLYPCASQRERTSIIREDLKILNPLFTPIDVCYEDTFSLTLKTSTTDRDHWPDKREAASWEASNKH